jgi:hypothetical protein
MKAYIVCCDFSKDSGAEAVVTGILNKYQGVRFQKWSWVIMSSETSSEIYEKLSEWHTDSDYIFISLITDDYAGHQPANIFNWLKRNIN